MQKVLTENLSKVAQGIFILVSSYCTEHIYLHHW